MKIGNKTWKLIWFCLGVLELIYAILAWIGLYVPTTFAAGMSEFSLFLVCVVFFLMYKSQSRFCSRLKVEPLWNPPNVEPKKDAMYLVVAQHYKTNDRRVETVDYIKGEWKIKNSWSIIAWAKVPKEFYAVDLREVPQ